MKLKVHNQSFAIRRALKDSPQKMWSREALMNAIQAAENWQKKNPNKNAEVHIRKRNLPLITGINKANKLSILNPGGMSGPQLSKRMEAFSTGDEKNQSDDGCFGIGIISSTLDWTQFAMISHLDGKTSMVHLRKDKHGDPEKVDIDGEDYYDVTDWAKKHEKERGYDLYNEWTEIVFLGRSADPRQDTFMNPYDDGGKWKAGTFSQEIYKRFWDIPENVKIVFEEGTHSNNKKLPMTFKPVSEIIEQTVAKYKNKGARREIVDCDDGTKIHYFYDPTADYDNTNNQAITYSGRMNTVQARSPLCGIIYSSYDKKEIFDVRYGRDWPKMAKHFGIMADFPNFRIFIEVPTSGFDQDTYREKLVKASDPDNERVTMRDYAEQVTDPDIMPKWFRDLVEKSNSNLEKIELDDTLKEIRNFFADLKIDKSGAGDFMKLVRGGKSKPKDIKPPAPKPSDNRRKVNKNLLNKKKNSNAIDINIVELDKEKVKINELTDHFGEYLWDQRTLMINPNSPQIIDFAERLINSDGTSQITGEVNSLEAEEKVGSPAKTVAKKCFIVQSYCHILSTISLEKEGKMPITDAEKFLEKDSLTVVLSGSVYTLMEYAKKLYTQENARLANTMLQSPKGWKPSKIVQGYNSPKQST